MNPREERGLALADQAKISRNHKGWVVPSQNGGGRYNVTLDGDSPRCTCPDYEIRGAKCKHIFAVEHTIKRQTKPTCQDCTLVLSSLSGVRFLWRISGCTKIIRLRGLSVQIRLYCKT